MKAAIVFVLLSLSCFALAGRNGHKKEQPAVLYFWCGQNSSLSNAAGMTIQLQLNILIIIII